MKLSEAVKVVCVQIPILGILVAPLCLLDEMREFLGNAWD